MPDSALKLGKRAGISKFVEDKEFEHIDIEYFVFTCFAQKKSSNGNSFHEKKVVFQKDRKSLEKRNYRKGRLSFDLYSSEFGQRVYKYGLTTFFSTFFETYCGLFRS